MGKIRIRFRKGFTEFFKNTFELRATEITDIMATEIEKEVQMRFVKEVEKIIGYVDEI